MSFGSTQPPSSEQVTIAYGQVSWKFNLPSGAYSALNPALEAFASWLSQQSAHKNSLLETGKPFTLALSFLGFLLEVKSELSCVESVVQAFEEHFLHDNDIHEVASQIPASNPAHALKTYFTASKAVKHAYRPANSALLEAASKDKANLCAIFGGQGPSNPNCLQDLRSLFAIYSVFLQELVTLAAREIKRLVSQTEHAFYYEGRGFNIERWLLDPNITPDPDYVASAPVSFPIIGLLGLCHYCVACKATGKHPGEMQRLLCGVTGHSQGVIIAAVVARSQSWEDFYQFAQCAIEILFRVGFESHHQTPASGLSMAAILDCEEAGEGSPTPMLRIRGLDSQSLRIMIEDTNTHLPPTDHIYPALINSRDEMVVAGPPKSLRGLNLRLRKIKAGEDLDQSQMPFCERKPVLRSRFLPITAAFHSPILKNVSANVLSHLSTMSLRGSDLTVPLYGTATGEDISKRGSQDLIAVLIQMVTVEPVDWPKACNFPKVSHILDFGPGGIGHLVQNIFEGSGVRVIIASDLSSLSQHVGSKAELFASSLPGSCPDWRQEYGPKLVRRPTGELVLSTKMSRLFGCPPIMVAGMTPTTVPWEFVTAVMKAGYHVELAGGGYHRPADFEKAIENTSRAVSTGCSITCNLIYANPKAIAWQVPLIHKLIQKGYPIDGLTIGAGVPSIEVAREYIRTIGLKHISFKPGSYGAMMTVVEIAKSCPDFPIGLQWTGGRGGGHHSFEDFHEPILKAYGKIRECANIVLIAGSGFGSASDTYPYITGDWSRARGFPPMPFDGVLLGSRMMVAKEAFTSSQAKELIVQASGVQDSQWYQTYQKPTGGVLTVQSEMGHPIHKLATRGVMLWHELDQTIFSIKDKAKRLAELQSRRATIMERLNKDYQRPWFAVNSQGESVEIGDLTYWEFLQRLIFLVYVQHQERWVDVSYERLVLDFAIRSQERLQPDSRPMIEDVKDPHEFLNIFITKYPHTSTELVHPQDESYFVGLCKRHGQKPVNFVPRIDEDFEHWFKKDSLWQAHDVDAIIDRDAQRICILQGPVAVQHSRVTDESAQSILDGIAKSHVEMVRRDFYSDDVIDPAMIPSRQSCSTKLIEQLEGVSIQQSHLQLCYRFSSSGRLADNPTFLANLESHLTGWAKACVLDDTVAQDQTRQKNPITGMFSPMHNHIVTIDYHEDKTVLALGVNDSKFNAKLESRDGKKISMTLSTLSRFTNEKIHLCLHYVYLPDGPWCRIYDDDDDTNLRDEKIKSFYAHTWLGNYPSSLRDASLEDVFFGNKITITQQMILELARTTSMSQGRQESIALTDDVVPLDIGVVLAWEALVQPLLISKINGNLLQLLHYSNSSEYCPNVRLLHIGDTVESNSRIKAIARHPGGKLVEVVATIYREGEAVMKVTSAFLLQRSFPHEDFDFRRIEENNVEVEIDSEKMRALLLSRSWFFLDNRNIDLLHKILVFRVTAELTYGPSNMIKNLKVRGKVHLQAANDMSLPIGQVKFEARSCQGNPVKAFLHRYSSKSDPVKPLPNAGWESSCSWKIRVPQTNSPYARVSKDTNPIHVSPIFARYAQLPGTVTHGMFTSAMVRRIIENAAAEADPARFKRWSTSFKGIVLPGDEIRVEMQHVAMAEGSLVFKVQAYNSSTDEMVLDAEAEVEQASTAYVFTGQGSQEKGMGMSLYESSSVARRIWDRSDKHLRDLYGFSIIDIVKGNPKSVTVHFGGKRGHKIRSNYLALKSHSTEHQCESTETCVINGLTEESRAYTFHHERGLLESTQFAQPALVIMEIAVFEDMKSKGLIQHHTLFAGHSLGEYSALGAVAEFLPLESLLNLIFYRGLAMQAPISRDQHGRTEYSMVAVNPSRIRKDFDQKAFEQLVLLISQETQNLLEIVNYNIEKQQYVCAGNLRALWVLTDMCNRLHQESLPSSVDNLVSIVRECLVGCPASTTDIELQRGIATIPLRGIDIPFHSTFLRSGIRSYRKVLEEKIPEGAIDPETLVDKWVPNVVGKPFAVDKEYVDHVKSVTGSKILEDLLQEVSVFA